MRPCNQCGEPVDNSAVLCASCEARPNSSRQTLASIAEPKPPETDSCGVVDSSHWTLVFVGAAMRGIPLAIVMMLASQIVTWFRMPLLTTCYIGLGVVGAYAMFGGLADLLPTGADKTG
ncbi:hypothetical protein Poly51_59570 [Rubripirellula tenax]|uniref:Uncharacterized protein n=1 Tax=Rubripirellula tenax TaxID=2528015 RepID=A0A5C6E757_9BACT|nr:hypothetical protein Poly51_59570 [Rubripirellula tenax]